jgi:hypothetical protein
VPIPFQVDNSASRRLTVILGAGASYDCADPKTAASVNGQYRPPLAKGIFDARFDKILEHYPKVERRLDELRTRLADSDNFEQVFRDLLDSAKRNENYWPLQVPLYLRELFWTISCDYMKGSSKFDTLVRRVLEAPPFEHVMFINLNYDLFLEHALEGYDHHEFADLSSYIPQSKKWLYVKPHGSVNWGSILENCPKDASGMPHPSQLWEMPKLSSELRLVGWNRSSHSFYPVGGSPGGYPYPRIVVPTDSPKEFVCPQSHTDQARSFTDGCTNFLLVGFSGRDNDVVDMLRSIPVGSRLTIVGKGSATTIFETMSSRVPSLKTKEISVSLRDAGFSGFIQGEEFEKFVTG